MSGWNPQLARGTGCCQILLNLTTLHSHCMSLADRVFSFNSYLGAKCTKYLRQAILLTLIIHHWFCHYSTLKRGHNDSDPRRPVMECTDHGSGKHELMSQAGAARQVWSKALVRCLQSKVGCRALRAYGRHAASLISCDAAQEKKRKGRGFPENNIRHKWDWAGFVC